MGRSRLISDFAFPEAQPLPRLLLFQTEPETQNIRKAHIVAATFSASVNRFIKQADWLTEADQPAVTALQKIAKQLDTADKINPPLMAQFGLFHRQLMKQRIVETEEIDELEALLNTDAG